MLALHEKIAQTVTPMGYEVLEVEQLARGLLRVTIDFPYISGQPEKFIQVNDCEKVTRQLQFAMEVENVDYQRLEVSSPGLDRLLRHERDLLRFEGKAVDITFKQPLTAAAEQGILPGHCANRRKFRGLVQSLQSLQNQLAHGHENPDSNKEALDPWRLLWTEVPIGQAEATGQRKRQQVQGLQSKNKPQKTKALQEAMVYKLPFSWEQVKEVRLVPEFVFSKPAGQVEMKGHEANEIVG